MYNAGAYDNFPTMLQGHKNFEHGKKSCGNQNGQKSNQYAERAIKCFQDVYYNCKHKKNINSRFIFFNKQ